MFKIEVTNLQSQIEHHVWLNQHSDDFIQFLPKQFGVPKENFTIYKIDESSLAVYHNLLKLNEFNKVGFSTGKVLVNRVHPAPSEEGEQIKKADFEAVKAEREAIFSDLTTPTITTPTLEPIDFLAGDEDGSTIPAAHELTVDEVQLVQEFVGTELSRWPYNDQGKFLGND
jgi:hypothetical protein